MSGHRQRFVALATVVAFVASLGLPFFSPEHAWVNDPDSGWGQPLVSAHTGARLVAAQAAPARERHCAVCHWMRALGNSLVGVKPARPELAVTPARRIDTVAVLISAPADTGPARAPPPSLA